MMGTQLFAEPLLRSFNRLEKVFIDNACDAGLDPSNIVLDGMDIEAY